MSGKRISNKIDKQTINNYTINNGSSGQSRKDYSIRWWIEICIAAIGVFGISETIKMLNIIYTTTWLVIPILCILSMLSYIAANALKELSLRFINFGTKMGHGDKNVRVPLNAYNFLSIAVFIGFQIIFYDVLHAYLMKSKEALTVLNIQSARIHTSCTLIFIIAGCLSIATLILLVGRLFKNLNWAQCLGKYRVLPCIVIIEGVLMSALVIINYFWI